MSFSTKFKGLYGLGILFVCGLIVLLSLGVWQLQRLEWKRGLIERIEERVKSPPIPLSQALKIWQKDGDIEYMRVRVKGEFDHDKERHYFTVDQGKTGWRVITPLKSEQGSIVLIDRGFVPDQLKEADTRMDGQTSGTVTITGLARKAERKKGIFQPDNNMKKNQWFWRDLEGMAASVYENPGPEVVPFYLEADNMPNAGGWPKGGVTRIDVPNNHLQYALTWFGLAAALVCVFIAFVRSHSANK